jgi:hypothetical protein
MTKTVRLLAGFVALLAAIAAASEASAEESRLTIYPAETNLIGYGRRMLVRFELSRVKSGAVTRAVLHLVGEAPPGPVEVRPLATQWGAMSDAFKAREAAGIWTEEDLKKPGYDVSRETWQRGDPDWTWAVQNAVRWQSPGGDFGAVAASINPTGSGSSADVTGLVKSWISRPESNYGLLLKLAGDDKGASLHRLSVHLVIEGKALVLDEALRIEEHPGWLPGTYRVQHPRLPYPTRGWLSALKADPARLAALTRAADSFDPEKGRARLLGELVLAQKLAPTPERARLIDRAIDARFPNHGGFEICYGLAVLYDWGYDILTPEQRRRLAYRLERYCTGQEGGSADTIISPYNDVGTSRFGCGLLWAALAIYPDIPAARKHLWRAKAYYIDTTIPVWHQVMGDDGGYWHEMHGYYLGNCLGRALARVLSSWSSATGEDLYQKHPWLENMLYFGIYSTRPNMYRMRVGDIKCSDYYYGEGPICLECFSALARHYKNPYGLWWLVRNGRAKPDGITPSEEPWGEPFPGDAKVKSWELLPPVRHSDGLGIVNMRSDWSEDATYVWFKCGPCFWSHSHLDSGSFCIYKRGALAIDAGNYSADTGSEHHTGYMLQSVAHNVITVTDPEEPPFVRKELTAPNDGGQRRTVSTFPTSAPYSVLEWLNRKEEFDTGKIVAFQTTKDFTYISADVTSAYTSSQSGTGHEPSRSRRVRKWLRSLVYLPPDHLVVFDEVESLDSSFKKRWLLHTIDQPRVQGNLITVERADTAFRFTAWDKSLKYAIAADKDHPFFRQHPDCKWYGGYQPQLYQYDGVMFMRTLSPPDPEIVLVGGPGEECWVDGKNYVRNRKGEPLSFRPYTGEGEAGRWRIEVSPSAASELDRFLHVIQVGLRRENTKPTSSRLFETSAGTGVIVELGRAREATIVFYIRGVGGQVKITERGRVVVDSRFAEEVLPNIPIEK